MPQLAAASGLIAGIAIIRKCGSATCKNAEVLIKITKEIKVFGKARVMQHAPGIAADWEVFAGFDKVMFV